MLWSTILYTTGEYGNGEWVTRVTVTREGQFVRSTLEVVDETEIYTGSENRLTMNQTYTREFQCIYELQRYPFDSQVTLSLLFLCNTTQGVQDQDGSGESCDGHSKA